MTLTGTVESDIDRDLAAGIAKGLDGVVRVENQLRVEAETAAEDRRDLEGEAAEREAERRSFGQWVERCDHLGRGEGCADRQRQRSRPPA